MSRYGIVATLFASALLYTAAFSEQAETKKSQEEIKALQQAYETSLETTTSIGRALKVLSSTPQSPLKVRGGAITFYTKDKWYPSSHASASQPYCTFVETTYLDFLEFKGINFADFPSTHLAPDWTITIYGYDANGNVSSRGIEVKAGMGCNNGHDHPEKTSVTISPVLSEFYTSDLPPGTVYKDNRRFRHTGCSGSAVDACERISRVDARVPGSPHVNYRFSCDGDCSINVGEPR